MPTCVFLAALLAAAPAAAEPAGSEVAAIFKKACLECHGASEAKGGLRLHDAASFSKVDAVELLRRVRLPRSDKEAMPKRGPLLATAQIAQLEAWIHAGAPWPKTEATRHWAYVPPQRPTLPKANARGAVDAFIDAELHRAGLRAATAASPAEQMRRLSLVAIGLPPSLAEVQAFEEAHARNPEAAVQQAVQRLLASPQFGVRWARPWLDAARYADSHGYQRDDLRQIWAFRDWVVDALNANLPFDQFTIEQLAGDLLPQPTLSQQIATGFHRCTPTNVEAGTEPEESRIHQVMDRVNTTAAVWLGSTLECAQCHDHKYDAFTQRDYYQLLAFFNNTPAEAQRSNPKAPGSIQYQGVMLPIPAKHPLIHREALTLQLQQTDAQIAALPAVPKNRTERLQLAEARKRRRDLQAQLKQGPAAASTEVMRELPQPRASSIFKRGDYTQPTLGVSTGLPAVFAAAAPQPPNRLGLARWLVSADNPLTARVIVNRWWAEVFGEGLVRTVEDFGIKGEAPSHPPLLDWLATEFMQSGWDMKHLLALMLQSQAFLRSSSMQDAKAREKDPANRLLWHGPRFRMDAEMIRDHALSLAGLMDLSQGGESIRPPQPEGLWNKVGGQQYNYQPSPPGERHRRGLYVVLKRGSPHPSFTLFDGSARNTCVLRRSRSNTPLQALALLNDPVFVEATQAFGQALAAQAQSLTRSQALTLAFRQALARHPDAGEIGLLHQLWDQRAKQQGEASAWLAVATALLNLDETLNIGG